MSTILLNSRHALPSSRSFLCRSNVAVSALNHVSKSASTSSSRSPSSRPAAKCHLESVCPGYFSDKPEHPNINLRPRRLAPAQGPGLSSLRPPHFNYVEKPESYHPLQVLTYWYRLARAYAKFYNVTFHKSMDNFRERREIEKRLGRWARGKISICNLAMIGGIQDRPELTRREFQLCMRLDHSFWRHRTSTQLRRLKSTLKSFEAFNAQYFRNIEAVDRDSGGGGWDDVLDRRGIHWSDVLGSCKPNLGHIWMLDLYKIIAYVFVRAAKWIPDSWVRTIYRYIVLEGGHGMRQLEILADTILILREGGFSKLSAEDIADYCLRSGSIGFLILAKEAVAQKSNPVTEAMRRIMVPRLEQHARRMVKCDWQRLPIPARFKQEEMVRSTDPKAMESWVYRS
ncbi:hypothetical protein LTR99_006009 [Exophiala xenobiotica]|uniref:Uncharacterized protein n=1 Tax=Vermiconidia calcicola TaxID=1690605 RepID=A0AAV9QFF6_9PEZI|nr:hypothetical protein LTR92_006102 [Exophiala xenobiotica]KAK5540919.1 hypothetical protein LTR25_002696 [Vermiconidia calcicola]KAK5549590.1 hypothetical protein LTR23_000698 [Chaetothyriales sp. CCFEE 6169]KAK5222997.1 hypothetical protein LTR72_005834 [Exophiala xenobiotica]KAK5267032.1 hypothetical protein LTR96_007699 [Exophiala xenobiotica]